MTIDDYIEGAPEPQRSTLKELRRTLRELLPDATEELSYGVPAFKVRGKAVAGYAHHKKHCGYYPHSESVLESLADDLDGYDWSRGTLRFPIDESLPKPLVSRLVAARMAEVGEPAQRCPGPHILAAASSSATSTPTGGRSSARCGRA